MMRNRISDALYTVEELGEWMFAVYEDFTLSIDYYEGFAEIIFF